MTEKCKENVQGALTTIDSLKKEILEGVVHLSTKTWWLWGLFLICLSPSILNGFHVSSYVFIGQMPDDYWCIVPQLEDAKWTPQQIRSITKINGTKSESCHIYNWDYSKLAQLSYADAVAYVQTAVKPEEVGCKSMSGNYYFFDQESDVSIVSEWDLVCEKKFWRTIVQVAVSLGKFIGAFMFGVIADKYGRKTSFSIACVVYMVSGPLNTFSPWYSMFLVGRLGLGLAGSGVYHSAYTIIMEIVTNNQRGYFSMLYSMSYPLGTLFLALSAYLVRPWRYLSLTAAVPAFLLILHCIFVIESPRWLLSKDKIHRAYKTVFKKKLQIEKQLLITQKQKPSPTSQSATQSFILLLKDAMREFINLYGPKKNRSRLLICHFSWAVVSLTYYVVALNADNFSADPYEYVALTGLAELPSYILPIIALRYFGRRTISTTLLVLSGLTMLLIIPLSDPNWIMGIAIVGRTCVAAVYAVIILHTTELFPTEVRNSAIGTSSTMSHIGSISAPFIVDYLGEFGWYIPTTICGVLSISAGLLVLLLPETKDQQLEDKVEEDLLKQSETIDLRCSS